MMYAANGHKSSLLCALWLEMAVFPVEQHEWEGHVKLLLSALFQMSVPKNARDWFECRGFQ
jgi:hypothetical protein